MTDIRQFGARGDGITRNTASIQAAIDDCAAQGGGTVLIPAGRWLTGSLFLGNNVNLQIEGGSVVLGSRDHADYPLIESRWEGKTRTVHAPLIGAEGCVGISVTGRGTVDGQGDAWWQLFRDGKLAHPRPRLIAFSACSDVLIEGVRLCNSPAWTVNPVACTRVRVTGVTIHNPPDSPNTDGINPDSCRQVIISDCLVSVGDDCITLKSGVEQESVDRLLPCEDITITNCILERGHGGVVIGSEMSGGVRNVVIGNCLFKGTDRGIRLKSRRGRGGVVENIQIGNCIMEDVLTPLAINLYYHCNGGRGLAAVADRHARPVDAGTPAFRSISLSNIQASGVKLAAAFVWGLPEMPVDGLRLHNVNIAMDHGWQEKGEVEMADGLEPACNQGFFARNVRGLELSAVRITGCRGVDYDLDGSVQRIT